jgi:hypothetical protein
MAQVETKDPKFILGAIAVLAGALGGGSMMGFTIEPKETTELRTEAALLRQQVDDLQKDVDTCAAKHPEMKSEMQTVSLPVVEKSTASE